MNKTSQNFNQISKVGLMENAKIILKYKFGFIPIQKKETKEKPNNRSFLISKSSINNSKDKTKKVKLKLSFSNNKSNVSDKNMKIYQSCTSLNKKSVSSHKKSRNIKNNIQGNINKYNTNNFFTYYNNTKAKILKKEINMHNNSYSLPNDYKKKKMIKILEYKKISNISPEKRNINNKSVINKKKSKYSNDMVLNVKPIIKKKENIINNHIWSKLITTIDQKQNSKIKKLKNKSLNKVNININTNININIKNNIINCRKENNDLSIDNQNNISYSNLTTNNVNININNSISNKKNNSKNYLPNISLNDITNFNPPEKDYSTISINNDKNSESIKEKKIQLNRIILERKKEKDRNNLEKSKEKEKEKEKENNLRRNSKNSKINKIISFKKENKIHKKNSSSNFEDSRMDMNNTLLYKREIKFCDTDTFKTNSNKSRKKKENDNDEKNNKKNWKKKFDKDINSKSKDNKEKEDFDNSNKNEMSFIGENNSIQKIEKQSIGKVSREQDNINNESDFTESNNRNIFNCNNKYYNLCNIPNGSTNISDNLKIYRLLSKNYSYNVSSRGIQDEAAKLFIHENPNINYHFISEIERNNIQINNLSKRKFLKLDDKSIFKILSFGIDSYMPLINSDIHIKNKINKSLNNIFEKVISGFKLKYKDYIEVTHHKFEQNKIKSYYNNNSYILDLILNCRIISKNVEESLEISCNYSSNNKNFDYLWKIDIQEKSKINKWISTEINMMKNVHKTISYTSQVSSFSFNDEILIQINIFNNNNIVEPDSIEWCEPIVSFASPLVYETTKFINNISYDELRACEVEKQILLWHDKLTNEQMDIYNEVNDIFKNNFKLEKAYCDKSRFCFYKFVMIPYKIGFVLKNKYCSFDINIIDLNNPIKNEIQCIYFMNTNNYTNKMDIRIGSTLTLYVIDMQVNN